MAYLGRQLTAGNYLKLDDISSSFNGSTTTFNLTSGGNAHFPGSAYSILVSLGGIIQEPEAAFTIDRDQITFASAPSASDDYFCLSLGLALAVGVPGNATVGTNQLASGGITYNDTITANTFVGQVNAGVGTITTLSGTTGTFSGNVSAVDGTFSGNVSVGGTLTYEDVTNVDSVGIATARVGIKVLAGGINAVGVVTATSFDGDVAGDVTGNLTGIATITGGTITGSAATFTNLNATNLTGTLSGISTNLITAVGIQSTGTVIGAGITQLNFIGTGNTFAVSGTTVDISISGGSAGAGGTWGSNTVGVSTVKIVGVNTTTIAGSATSEGALQVHGNLGINEGMLITDSNIITSLSVPSGKNGLFIGPVTVGTGATIDVATNSVLVVV